MCMYAQLFIFFFAMHWIISFLLKTSKTVKVELNFLEYSRLKNMLVCLMIF